MIRLQVIGRLGKDATVNSVNGQNVINFSLAHTEKYTDKQGNKQEKTTWVDCAFWVKSTTLAPYLTKGTEVYVEGDPEARAFSRNDGTAGSSLSVRVRSLQLLGGNRSNGGASSTTSEAPATSGNDDFADDLPF
jgi:single-strand DNA-binding protein